MTALFPVITSDTRLEAMELLPHYPIELLFQRPKEAIVPFHDLEMEYQVYWEVSPFPDLARAGQTFRVEILGHQNLTQRYQDKIYKYRADYMIDREGWAFPGVDIRNDYQHQYDYYAKHIVVSDPVTGKVLSSARMNIPREPGSNGNGNLGTGFLIESIIDPDLVPRSYLNIIRRQDVATVERVFPHIKIGRRSLESIIAAMDALAVTGYLSGYTTWVFQSNDKFLKLLDRLFSIQTATNRPDNPSGYLLFSQTTCLANGDPDTCHTILLNTTHGLLNHRDPRNFLSTALPPNEQDYYLDELRQQIISKI